MISVMVTIAHRGKRREHASKRAVQTRLMRHVIEKNSAMSRCARRVHMKEAQAVVFTIPRRRLFVNACDSA